MNYGSLISTLLVPFLGRPEGPFGLQSPRSESAAAPPKWYVKISNQLVLGSVPYTPDYATSSASPTAPNSTPCPYRPVSILFFT